MAEFTRDEVARIAALAHLALDDGEMDVFARQLGAILAYAEQVQQVDTTGVPATETGSGVLFHEARETRTPASLSGRDDELQPSLDRETALAQAPDASVDAGFFKVPRAI
jgi:aspartyl-tRNA(Asn)/glutamyl-tRNA(Gln) amidotransferase subunit C